MRRRSTQHSAPALLNSSPFLRDPLRASCCGRRELLLRVLLRFHRICVRRAIRDLRELVNPTAPRQQYLHESRHQVAVKRIRGERGRFVNLSTEASSSQKGTEPTADHPPTPEASSSPSLASSIGSSVSSPLVEISEQSMTPGFAQEARASAGYAQPSAATMWGAGARAQPEDPQMPVSATMNLPPAPISMPMTQPERSLSMPVPRVPIPMPAPVPQHAPMPAPVPAAAPFTDTLHGYEGAAAARFGFPSHTSPSLSPQEAAHAAWVRARGDLPRRVPHEHLTDAPGYTPPYGSAPPPNAPPPMMPQHLMRAGGSMPAYFNMPPPTIPMKNPPTVLSMQPNVSSMPMAVAIPSSMPMSNMPMPRTSNMPPMPIRMPVTEPTVAVQPPPTVLSAQQGGIPTPMSQAVSRAPYPMSSVPSMSSYSTGWVDVYPDSRAPGRPQENPWTTPTTQPSVPSPPAYAPAPPSPGTKRRIETLDLPQDLRMPSRPASTMGGNGLPMIRSDSLDLFNDAEMEDAIENLL